ncbi:MAG: Crp/Fnr family transcriptional regulator [Porcipelethomonas sp.]
MEEKNLKPNMITFKEDDILIEEGVVCSEMFKVVSGKAALYTNYNKENEYLIGIISENSCFGEISMFTQTPNSYTVVAVSDILVLRIGFDTFEDFIKNNTKNALQIMTNMAKQNLSLRKNIELLFDELTEINGGVKRSEELKKRFAHSRAVNIDGISFIP